MDDELNAWTEERHRRQVRDFLARLVCSVEQAEVDLPHIVLCSDPESGTVSYSGPFPDVLSALTFAEREHATELAIATGTPLMFSVAALYPGSGSA